MQTMIHPDFETHGRHRKTKTGVTKAPQKALMSSKFFLRNCGFVSDFSDDILCTILCIYEVNALVTVKQRWLRITWCCNNGGTNLRLRRGGL